MEEEKTQAWTFSSEYCTECCHLVYTSIQRFWWCNYPQNGWTFLYFLKFSTFSANFVFVLFWTTTAKAFNKTAAKQLSELLHVWSGNNNKNWKVFGQPQQVLSPLISVSKWWLKCTGWGRNNNKNNKTNCDSVLEAWACWKSYRSWKLAWTNSAAKYADIRDSLVGGAILYNSVAVRPPPAHTHPPSNQCEGKKFFFLKGSFSYRIWLCWTA